jgi:hypothetical protein
MIKSSPGLSKLNSALESDVSYQWLSGKALAFEKPAINDFL